MNSAARASYDRRHAESLSLVKAVDLGGVSVKPSKAHETSDQLRLLELAMAESLSGLAVCNQFGRVLLANQQMTLLFGYDAGDLLRRDFRTIVPDVAFASESNSELMSPPPVNVRTTDQAHAVREVNGLRKDGTTVPISIAISPLAGQSECLFVASVIDLTERRRLEARLSAAERQARLQALMSSVATRCAAAAFEQMDAALADVLSDLGDALSLDRASAYLPAPGDGASMHADYVWTRPGCAAPPDGFDPATSLPWLMAQARDGGSASAATLDAVPGAIDRESLRSLGARSCAAVPFGGHEMRGALVVDARAERTWPPDVIESLQLVAAVMGQALARKADRARLDSGLEELRRQRDQTLRENAVVRREMAAVQVDRTIASESVAIRRVLAQVQQVAPTTATVLLLGETGVGKEVFAQAIHNQSARNRRPMIRVSCAAIPSALIESELFGRERGAFTGALSRQIGRFEAANGSTIFLDEIGDLPLEIQVKLLRVIQERTVERLGGNSSMKVDVRIIAATNRNLEQAVANGTFREDLFYRLNVFPITIPPLRERVDDIPTLIWTFIDEFSRAFGKKVDSVSKDSLVALQRYSWPGNVRELRNVIEREMIVSTGTTLVVGAPRAVASQRRAASSRLVDVEVEHIRSVLESCGWRVRGNGGAAERLGVKPTTLESRMARLGIAREKPQPQI